MQAFSVTWGSAPLIRAAKAFSRSLRINLRKV
nr:MAG TPA: hypothetical protein [Caudoviricetes sp.]